MATPPQSRGARFIRLARMTSSVASRYALSRIKSFTKSDTDASSILAEAHRLGGERIAETLGELKGAVMKVGQMASIGTDWLPKELAEPLKALQQEAPPVEFQVIADQIESELGSPPEMLFRRFDRVPMAAASIGQVHRAQTDDGREVVVKVQYPGVDKSVDSDLAQLKFALQAAGLLTLPRKVRKQLFRELKARLHEELDYTNEAQNVRLFGELFADDDRVVIPKVVGERSSQRVLTLTYEPGTPLADINDKDFSQNERDYFGRLLADVFFSMIFVHRTVHADPNPANFAFRENQLVLYDFGCVKKLPETLVIGYRDIIHAVFDRDADELEKGLINIGARNMDVEKLGQDFYGPFLDLLQPILGLDGPYHFGRSTLGRDMFTFMARRREVHHAFQPPIDGVFVNRSMAGHFNSMRKLGARFSLHQVILPVLQSS